MRRTLVLCRGAKGRGWYKRYQALGPLGFSRNPPPAPFDWTRGLPAPSPCTASAALSLEEEGEGEGGEVGPGASNRRGPPAPPRPSVFFDLAIEQEPVGRLVIELAHEVVPKTVENFMLLTRGTEQFSYKGTKVCDILKESSVRLGDVETNNGTMSHSATGQRYFRDENFIIPHTAAGLVSMVTSGVHSNGSQFYISLGPCPHFNGRCVTFGRVIEGDKVIKEIEKVYTFRGTPARDIAIADCGVLEYAGVQLTDPSPSVVAVDKPTFHLPLQRGHASSSS